MPPLPDHIGGYKVVQALGKGGMGAVYLAQDPAIGRLVAIKLLREGLDNPELRERFAREARSAGRLRHPNIVTIFHVGEHESQPYIVMEYIPGDTLADIVKQRLPLTVRHKLRIIEDVCRGLAHAHKSGVVHRDIKPANILVDSEGIVKILDFGIARIGEQELTRLGMMMGTPNYMSPEQINPGTSDHRSDVFSVGLVLYEFLAYTRAFPGDSFAVLHSIVNSEPEPIEVLVPDLDTQVGAILRRALQKNPENRYQDIATMRVDLARVRGRLRVASASEDVSDEGPVTSPAENGPNTDTPTVVVLPLTLISQHVMLARQAVEASQFERALTECELALALEPGNAEATAIGHQARHAIDLRAGSDLLNDARSAYARGRLTIALELLAQVESLGLTGDPASAVLNEANTLRQEIEAVRQNAVRTRAAVNQSRAQLNAGNLDAARRAAEEARSGAPDDDDDVKALQAEIAHAFAERDRKAAEEKRQRERAAQELQRREQAAHELQQREQLARESQRREAAAREIQREEAARQIRQREQAAQEQQKREDAANRALMTGRSSDETVLLNRQALPSRGAPPAPKAGPSLSSIQDLRRPSWLIPMAAVVLIALVVGSIVMIRRSRTAGDTVQSVSTISIAPTTSTVPPTISSVETTTPTTASAGNPQVAALHNELTQALGKGDTGRAARLLREAPARLQSEPAIARDIDQLVDVARNAASRAQQQVPKANSSSSEYRDGVQLQSQGAVLGQDGRKLEAATAFVDAAQLFTRARSANPLAAASTSIPPTLAPATTSSVPPTSIAPPTIAPSTIAPPTTIAPQPTTSVPAPVGPTRAQDETAIGGLLQEYMAGYRALSLEAIRKVFPSVMANFRDTRAFEVELRNVRIEVKGDGAVVTCARVVHFTPTAGRSIDRTFDAVFNLRRNPAGWIIESLNEKSR